MSDWSEVTASAPCSCCGRSRRCSRTADGSMLTCYHETTHPTWGVGTTKQAADGQEFTLFVDPASRQNGSTTSAPTVTQTGNEKLADADTLHSVYSALLDALTLDPQHERELARRGLSGQHIASMRQCGYRSLPGSGRSRIVSRLIDADNESKLPTVPGFVIRAHEGRRYWTIRGPAGLLIPVRDAEQRIIAIMLRPDEPRAGRKYVWLTSRQKGSGVSPGTPVHVPVGQRSDVVRLTEGGLKADAATLASGVPTVGLPGVSLWRRAAAVLSAIGAKRVLVSMDADASRKKDVANSLASCVSHLQAAGFDVALETWDEADGKGIDDLLLAGKTPTVLEGQALQTHIAAMLDLAGQASDDEIGGRHKIKVTPNEHETTAAVLIALADDPHVYRRGDMLVHCAADDSVTTEEGIERPVGTPRMRPMPQGYLQERLSVQCYFCRDRETKYGTTEEQVAVPRSIVNNIHTRGFWPGLRPLDAITEIPVLRADGSILTEQGYDPATRLLYVPSIEISPIPDRPTLADAMRAVERLVEVFADFPFSQPIHRAAALSGVLTPLARRAFSGPAPLHLVDANVRGSGKTLLVDAIGGITTGRTMPRFSYAAGDEEMRKRITAIAMAGDSEVLIDNILQDLGGQSLDAALTCEEWKDRELGASRIVCFPLKATWYATGNNVVLKADTSRRVCHIRLDSRLENPEQREGFRHPNLLQFVHEHRGELLAAGLTILRAYFVAGRPAQGLKPWGSFEGWSDVVRSAIVWAGQADPGDTRTELQARSDKDAAALRMLVAGWNELATFSDKPLTSSMIAALLDEHANRFAAVREALLTLCDKDKLTSRSIAYALRKHKGRVVTDRTIESKPGHGGVCVWSIPIVNSTATGGHGGHGGHAPADLTREKCRIPAAKRNKNQMESAETSPPCPPSQPEEFAEWAS